MRLSKLIVIAVLVNYADSRHLLNQEIRPYSVIENSKNVSMYVSYEPEMFKQNNVSRERRQTPDNFYTKPNGIPYFGIKYPISGEDRNKLSVIRRMGEADDRLSRDAGGGLSLINIIDRAATLTQKLIPNLANQLTAAGKIKLFHIDKHDVTAQAHATRNFPNNPNIPNYNTFGGKLGYTYDNKIGASLGMAHTDLFKKTDYSAMGNLNVFRDHASSLDLKAGLSKSLSPYISNNKWKPFAGLSFTKVFDYLKTIF